MTRLVRGLALALVLAIPMPALAVDSGYPPAPTLREARLLVDAGQYARAITTLAEIVVADPGDADALNLLGFSLRKSGRQEDAEVYYLRALAIDPAHVGANEYLGELYVETGRLDLAAERLAILAAACGDGCAEAAELAALIAAAQ